MCKGRLVGLLLCAEEQTFNWPSWGQDSHTLFTSPPLPRCSTRQQRWSVPRVTCVLSAAVHSVPQAHWVGTSSSTQKTNCPTARCVGHASPVMPLSTGEELDTHMGRWKWGLDLELPSPGGSQKGYRLGDRARMFTHIGGWGCSHTPHSMSFCWRHYESEMESN